MELIRGPKPLTDAENAFASAKLALIRKEVALGQQLDPCADLHDRASGCSRFSVRDEDLSSSRRNMRRANRLANLAKRS